MVLPERDILASGRFLLFLTGPWILNVLFLHVEAGPGIPVCELLTAGHLVTYETTVLTTNPKTISGHEYA